MKEITVSTVQGMGDIFWVYQKLAPYFDKINLNILCIDFSGVQLRSKSFCKMLPKINNVVFSRVSSKAYDDLAKSRCKINNVLEAHERFINENCQEFTGSELDALGIGCDTAHVSYAVNEPLEKGIRLEDIDYKSKIETFVDLGLPPIVVKEDYLCLFVAGQKNDFIWTPIQWLYATKKLLKILNTKKIKLIGADWDRPIQEQIFKDLQFDYDVESCVGADLPASIDIIRKSKFFFGFQSGLNIVADNYDVHQLMLYYQHLKPMQYSWCKKENIDRKFHAALFSDDVELTLKRLERTYHES